MVRLGRVLVHRGTSLLDAIGVGIIEGHEHAIPDDHRVHPFHVVLERAPGDARPFFMDPTRAVPRLEVDVLEEVGRYALIGQHVTSRSGPEIVAHEHRLSLQHDHRWVIASR